MTELIRHERDKMPVRVFICQKCRKSGGTLEKAGDGYVHKKCPVLVRR